MQMRRMGFLLYSFFGYFVATFGALVVYFFEDPVWQVAGLTIPFITLASSWSTYYFLYYRHKPPVVGGQAYISIPVQPNMVVE